MPGSATPRRAARRQQYAALPWRRRADGGVEVLLVTSRATRRLVVPKGWPMEGLDPAGAAAQEAWEEAGVRGEVSGPALGVFHYDKRLKSGLIRRLRVEIFALKVESEAEDWPERSQRTRRWMPPEAAAAEVDEPDLAALLRTFRP